MQSTKYILWEEQGRWCGYLQDYPDHITHGKSFEELQSKLRRLQHDLASQEQGVTNQECAQPDDRTAETPYPIPRRTKTNARLEKLFMLMLASL